MFTCNTDTTKLISATIQTQILIVLLAGTGKTTLLSVKTQTMSPGANADIKAAPLQSTNSEKSPGALGSTASGTAASLKQPANNQSTL